jgi:hypothetical protein
VPNHTRHPAALAAAIALAGAVPAAQAVDALVIEARRARGAGIELRGLALRLEPGARADRPRATLRAAVVDAGPTLGSLRQLRIDCGAARLDEPAPGCARARVRAAASPLGPLAFDAAFGLRTDLGTARLEGSGLALGGGRARFTAALGADRWQFDATLERATPRELLPLLPGASALPADLALAGRVDGRLRLAGRVDQGGFDALELGATLGEGTFSNTDGTLAAEQLAATLTITLQPAAPAAGSGGAPALALAATLQADAGQALAGPAFLDLGVHPLQARAQGAWIGERIALDELAVSLRDLLQADGSATLVPAARDAAASPGTAAPWLRAARIDVAELAVGPAYDAVLKTLLAGTPFGQLRAGGNARGRVEVEDGAPRRLALRLDEVSFADARGGSLRMDGLQGELNWAPAGTAPAAPSYLSWRSGGAYGLSGGAARLELQLQGRDVALRAPARIPIFDGGLAVREFSLRAAGTDATQLVFEGDVEPISMPLIAAAFGWPEFQGSVSGRIPRVEYRDRLLTVGGDLEARVFDGRVIGRNLRLQDPLGRWPRLFADVAIDNLDLALVTRTFAIGSITGRLEGRVTGLELFAWSPVAFDAELRTPPGDRSLHRISAKAIGSISNVGGGGGGVESALQSGLFRLFDSYRYDRLGIRCRLRDEVCLMSGIEPAGTGYYLLKGKGVPHIDIVGNEGRVNWPQLVSQIVAQMNSEGELRIE